MFKLECGEMNGPEIVGLPFVPVLGKEQRFQKYTSLVGFVFDHKWFVRLHRSWSQGKRPHSISKCALRKGVLGQITTDDIQWSGCSIWHDDLTWDHIRKIIEEESKLPDNDYYSIERTAKRILPSEFRKDTQKCESSVSCPKCNCLIDACSTVDSIDTNEDRTIVVDCPDCRALFRVCLFVAAIVECEPQNDK